MVFNTPYPSCFPYLRFYPIFLVEILTKLEVVCPAGVKTGGSDLSRDDVTRCLKSQNSFQNCFPAGLWRDLSMDSCVKMPRLNSKFAVLSVPVKRQVNWAICKRKSRVSESSLFIYLFIYIRRPFFCFRFFFFSLTWTVCMQCQMQYLVVRVNQFLNCRILNSSRPWITSLFLRRLSR